MISRERSRKIFHVTSSFYVKGAVRGSNVTFIFIGTPHASLANNDTPFIRSALKKRDVRFKRTQKYFVSFW